MSRDRLKELFFHERPYDPSDPILRDMAKELARGKTVVTWVNGSEVEFSLSNGQVAAREALRGGG